LPGVQPILVDENGNIIEGSDASLLKNPSEFLSGNLCIKQENNMI
jgi:hypothetical protein